MLPEAAREELRKIFERNRVSRNDMVFNPGASHSQADDILCSLLETLGFADVVEEYNRIQPKWYA